MPVNRNTLLRYKTIDRMLRKGRKVTLDELIEACNDALYETNGYGEVSRRTIQHDIQEMRYSQALGYYAPIKVMDKVMLFTDCELWNNRLQNGADLSQSWDKYKKIAPDARLYIFELAGYGQSPINMERDDVFCIAGWSDKVFDILAALERGNSAIDEICRIVV